MALGELYKPKGLALEQARAVLQVEEPYAVNVALGCKNQCKYCFVPLVRRTSRDLPQEMRCPRIEPLRLVRRQLKLARERRRPFPEGVFVSFMTDPFLPQNRGTTERLIGYLLDHGISVATSSKSGVSGHFGVRHGITVVSLGRDFWKEWEPNAPSPRQRIQLLKRAHNRGDFTWVSMEPYPPPAIHEQDIDELLKKMDFVNLIVFGRWQYDRRAATEEARRAYTKVLDEAARFCSKHRIRFHPKSETLDFITKKNNIAQTITISSKKVIYN